MVTVALSAGAYAAKNIGLRSTGGSIFALCEHCYVSQVAKALATHSTFVYIINKEQII